MDVREWLHGLGLGQYGQRFRDNKIDADVLADLTDGDLEKLGIPLGDRKRLLRAVAARAAHQLRPDQARRAAAATALAPHIFVPPDAERRPITVMFCDLVGSTSLASRLDVEDWRNILNAYLDEASSAVAGLGGHVARRVGDGLLVLFGYPQAKRR
jgi:class 3 adenylate cyclase